MNWIMPENTDWAKQMNAHEPTRSYGQEIYDLVKNHSYESALEIGAAWGTSACAILMGGKGHLTSVDKDETAKAPQEVEANGWKDRFTFILSNSDEFFENNQESFDVVYIDGSHLYKNAKPDMFNGWDILKKGGLFICDDFTHPANVTVDDNGKFSEYGVSLALCELLKEKKITNIGTTTRLFWTVK